MSAGVLEASAVSAPTGADVHAAATRYPTVAPLKRAADKAPLLSVGQHARIASLQGGASR